MKNVIVGIGEALWDVLPNGKKIGGAPANFAYIVSQLGLESVAISALGNDELGQELRENLDRKHLKYILPVVAYPTGTVEVQLNEEGIPCYDIKENVAWDNIPFTEDLEHIASHVMAVCFGSLAQRSPVSRDTINRFLDVVPDEEGRYKIFDVNLRQHFYNREIIHESAMWCNVLKINDEELVEIGKIFGWPELSMKETCLKLLADYNLKILILTCGVNGSYVFEKSLYLLFPLRELKLLIRLVPATLLLLHLWLLC